MNCEHCLKTGALDGGVAHALIRLGAALGRNLRSALARLAQLG